MNKDSTYLVLTELETPTLLLISAIVLHFTISDAALVAQSSGNHTIKCSIGTEDTVHWDLEAPGIQRKRLRPDVLLVDLKRRE
jgi:hypothetical protein